MDVFQSILNWCGTQISSLLSWLCVVLPDSPFLALEDLIANSGLSEILPVIQYFLPLDVILDITTAWLSCILIYYGYSVILRFIKAIG